MSQLATRQQAQPLEQLLLGGDLKPLNPEQRLEYYNAVCKSLDLNPLTRPFDYITLNGKLTLYARKDATEQLRKRDRVSVTIAAREVVEGVYIVTARATTPDGRTDESIGAVTIEGLKGEARANAMMKSETKAKRRVTLSICGLGFLDETEIEAIPSATPVTPSDGPIPIPTFENLLDWALEEFGLEREDVLQILRDAGFGSYHPRHHQAMITAIAEACALNAQEGEAKV